MNKKKISKTKREGKEEGQLDGGGGWYVLVSPDTKLLETVCRTRKREREKSIQDSMYSGYFPLFFRLSS